MKKKIFLTLYTLLTFLKLFFAEVRIIGEAESGFLVFKFYPTINNFFGGGEETEINLSLQKNTWYFNEKYFKIGLDYFNPWWILPFEILILVWWVTTLSLSIFLTCFYLMKFFRKLRIHKSD
jgi:hypothetical protein